MANTDQDHYDGLVRAGTKARVIARRSGDRSDAWMTQFTDELEACGMTPEQFKAAVEAFDGKPVPVPVPARIVEALRTSGVTLG